MSLVRDQIRPWRRGVAGDRGALRSRLAAVPGTALPTCYDIFLLTPYFDFVSGTFVI